MYKVYLSSSTQDKSFGVQNFGTEEFRMSQITNIIEQSLLNSEEYVVFRNTQNMTKEEIIKDSNNINCNIHVAIHSNYGNILGPQCYIKVGDEIANGFGKEIYKELHLLYYDKNIDNALIYDKNIKEINNVKSSAVLIIVGNHENEQDARWIVENIRSIGEAIARGIQKGFKLKLC